LCHAKLSETELNAVCHDVSLDEEVVMKVWATENRSEVL
jgi:hypothetical protein